jgi:hypothetical protein
MQRSKIRRCSVLHSFEKLNEGMPILVGRQDPQVRTLAAHKDAIRERAEAGHQACRFHPAITFVARQYGKRSSRFARRPLRPVHCNSPLVSGGSAKLSVTDGCHCRR